MSLKGDCHEVEDTPYLKLLVTSGMKLEGVCHDLDLQFYYKHESHLEGDSYDQKFLEKCSLLIRYAIVMSLE
jgi:hypothetical protein